MSGAVSARPGMPGEMDDKHRTPWLVLHVPHSATHVPPDLRPQILLDAESLALEQLRMTDHFTDELFTPATPSTRVVFPVSRLIVDPERFREDANEAMAERGMGAIYEKTANGEPLRCPPSPKAREGLLARFYDPHHRRLESAVRGALDAHSFCLVLDCHSFPARALPYEADQTARRPEICIGTDEFHTPPWMCELAVVAFTAAGFDVAVNRPFAGALVPASQHRKRSDVMALMIEIRRDLYMDETTGERRPNFAAFKRRLIDLLDQLCSRVCDRRGSVR